MHKYKKVYAAIDLHSNRSMLGYMDPEGHYIEQEQFTTTIDNLRGHVVGIPSEHVHLTIEQGNMAFWAAEQLREHVDELIICDPHHNALISRNINKNDRLDTLRLCKLLRLGELKAVWRPKQLGIRRVFYHQVKEYQRLTKTLSIHKRQLQASLRHWGINVSLAKRDYHHPEKLLARVERPLLAEELAGKFSFIQTIARQKRQQWDRIAQTGTRFWEISEFQKMSGVGPAGAHMFSGYIQTPHRFRRRGQLISFCQLGVRKFTSDGRKVRNERLSRAGHGCLKNLAHVAWKASVGADNEVNGFYQASLARCGDPVNARLNTQRKILITLWSLWKHNRTYQPEKFFSGDGDSAR